MKLSMIDYSSKGTLTFLLRHQLTMRAIIILVVYLVLLFGDSVLAESPHRDNQTKVLNSSPVKSGTVTVNDLTSVQIAHIVQIINRFRAIIQTGNLRSKWTASNESNYRKVRYSIVFEEEAQFECDDNLNPEDFKSDSYTWRRIQETEKSHFKYSSDWDPRIEERLVDPLNHSILHAAAELDTLRMALSPDVTELGCFEKTCNGYKYIACKTGQTINVDSPLHTPSGRCEADKDCTLSGYTRCDMALGLCDLDEPNYSLASSVSRQRVNPDDTQCDLSSGFCKKPKVSPLICHSLVSPYFPSTFKEKCNGKFETGNEMTQDERISIVETVNKYRAMINNNCTFPFGVPRPASNYRKVKYNCLLEAESMFNCSASTPYTSTRDIWRGWGHKYTDRKALFHRAAPDPSRWLLYPNNQTVRSEMEDAAFMNFFLSADVTEVGCWIKVCKDLTHANQKAYEYIACKTNHDQNLPYDAPLYTPGQRCNVDADCTLPGYPTCDASVGLCDNKTHLELKQDADLHICENPTIVWMLRKMEPCSSGYNTGSNISNVERELIVYTVNQFRALINNNCNFGKGIVKQTSNYRKVKYSCALEEDAKFECANIDRSEFKSDNYIWRATKSDPGKFRTVVLHAHYPWKEEMLISPKDQTIGGNVEKINFARLVLSPKVTEIGCFVKVCKGIEYVACLTGHPINSPQYEPLYKPGKRCMANVDCTLPGYAICDSETGLCDTS